MDREKLSEIQGAEHGIEYGPATVYQRLRPHPFESMAAPAIAPQKGETLYLSILTSDLPRSVDGGKSWRPQPKRGKPVSPAGAPWRPGSPRIAGHLGAKGREYLDF